MTIHLIDYLAYVMHCEISDLERAPRFKLLYQIEKIPAEACSLTEWTQCADYLYPLKGAFSCSEEARAFLINKIKASV